MAEATLAITFFPLGDGPRTDTIDAKALARGEATPADADAGLAAPDNSLAPAAIELVDCGRPFPHHELLIVDEGGRPLPERRVGQIVVRGPSVTNGYFEDPELTAETCKSLPADPPGAAPWLHTGDLGYLAGGGLFVCGRLKDIIIVRGRNYYPSDIEWAVSELPKVRRGSVIAFGVFVDSHGGVINAGLG